MSQYHFIITGQMSGTREGQEAVQIRTQHGTAEAPAGCLYGEVFKQAFETLTLALSAGMPDGFEEQEPIVLFWSLEPQELP